MVLATMFVSLPFVVREVEPVLRELGVEQEEAAATFGASALRTFWHITLPNIGSAVAYGVVLTVARSVGEFGAVSVVSGHLVGRTQTLTLYVADRYAAFDLTGAYAAATVLGLIAVLALLGMHALRRGVAEVSGARGAGARARRRGGCRTPSGAPGDAGDGAEPGRLGAVSAALRVGDPRANSCPRRPKVDTVELSTQLFPYVHRTTRPSSTSSGRQVVVVGGGLVATTKVDGILPCAPARLVVIAPEVSPTIAAHAAAGALEWRRRPYQLGDLAGADLAFGASDDRAVNAAVADEARARRVPVLAVDDIPHCDFIAPALVRRGDLTVAISTHGRSPAMARRARVWLEHSLPAHWAALLDVAATARAQLTPATRRAIPPDAWQSALDGPVEDLVAHDHAPAALSLLLARLHAAARPTPALDTPSPQSDAVVSEAPGAVPRALVEA